MGRRSDDMVLRQVIAAVREVARLPDLEITRGTRLAEDLALDSLDVVEVAMSLEETFETEIPQDEVRRLRSVGDVADYLRHHLVLGRDETAAAWDAPAPHG